MELLAQLALNGIIAGFLYALLGASWSIIFSATRTFHFAHALVLAVAGYAAVLISSNMGLPLVLGFAGAIACAVLLGCAIDVVVYRPFRQMRSGAFAAFIASLGILILGENVIRLIFSGSPRGLAGFPIAPIGVGPVSLTTLNLFSIVVSGLVILALGFYLTRTRSGKAVRAIANNADMATALGIETEKVTTLVFAIGSAAGALAAVLIVLDGIATPGMGMMPLFSAVIVTFVAGIGDLPGTLIAGLVLGLAENMAMAVMPSGWTVIVGFILLLVIIIVRPRGIRGDLLASAKS